MTYKLGYIKESHERAKRQLREYVMFEDIQIYIKDKVSNGIDVRAVLDRITSSIPSHLLREIDSIYVGMFENFKQLDTNAMYKDGAIYVSNEQDDEQDMVDDIVHEIAHSLENPYGYIIYADGRLESEFMAKRTRLYEILKAEGLKPKKSLFMDPEYNLEMDMYLYQVVGYDRLNFIVSSYGLFTSAYSATAIREYFSNGFEYFFLDDRKYLKEICPVLYSKILEIYKEDESEY